MLENRGIRVALVSLVVTLSILLARFIAFILSNSLILLADTLHSFFDIIAGIIAIYSIKIALKPSDREHTYGHGKAESLGALFEALLLAIVCIIVMYEAYQRIIHNEASTVGFDFLVLSIVALTLIADLWRARTLKKISSEISSQVLEGDSLHYLSDAYITSSVISVIILSMFFFKGQSLIYLDSIAASMISIYFLISGFRLGKRAIDDLLDRAPPGVVETVNKIIKESNCIPTRIRARKVSNKLFLDAVVCLPWNLDSYHAHEIAKRIEESVRKNLNFKEIDMTIHMEPLLSAEEEKIKERIKNIVSDLKINIHSLTLEKPGEKFDVRMHAEIPASISIEEAHRRVTELENRIKEIESIKQVLIHIEPIRTLRPEITEVVRKLLKENPEIGEKMKIKTVLVSDFNQKTYLDLICDFPRNLTVEEVHKTTASFESLLREVLGDDIIVTIHQEPI